MYVYIYIYIYRCAATAVAASSASTHTRSTCHAPPWERSTFTCCGNCMVILQLRRHLALVSACWTSGVRLPKHVAGYQTSSAGAPHHMLSRLLAASPCPPGATAQCAVLGGRASSSFLIAALLPLASHVRAAAGVCMYVCVCMYGCMLHR